MLKFIKKRLPTRRNIEKLLMLEGRTLRDRIYWSVDRMGVTRAVFIGLFVMLLPIPIQTLTVGFIGILIRANLIISITLVWVTNPVTMVPIFYGCYQFGLWLLHPIAPPAFPDNLDITHLLTQIEQIWQPLLLGCVVLGLILGTIGAVLVYSLWPLFTKKGRSHDGCGR